MGEAPGTVVDREPTPADDEIDRATPPPDRSGSPTSYERWSYNTAVAAFMEFTNELYHYVQSEDGARRETLDDAVDTVLLLMAPMAPHITAELWERRRRRPRPRPQPWPVADPAMTTWSTTVP